MISKDFNIYSRFIVSNFSYYWIIFKQDSETFEEKNIRSHYEWIFSIQSFKNCPFLFPFLPRKIKLIFHVFSLLQSLYAQQLNPTSRVNNVPRSSRLENRNTVTILFSQRISSSRAPTVTSLSKQWYFSARAAPPPSEHFISFGSARHASLSRLRGENGATLPRQRGGASLRAVSREIYGERGKFIDSISAIFNRARRVRARLEFANERTPCPLHSSFSPPSLLPARLIVSAEGTRETFCKIRASKFSSSCRLTWVNCSPFTINKNKFFMNLYIYVKFFRLYI